MRPLETLLHAYPLGQAFSQYAAPIAFPNFPTIVSSNECMLLYTSQAGGAVTRTVDGVTWTTSTPFTGATGEIFWDAVNSAFTTFEKITSTTYRFRRSVDGVTWTSATTNITSAATPRYIGYRSTSGLHFATAASNLYNSADGITWTAQTLPLPAQNNVMLKSNKFAMAGAASGGNYEFYDSTTGMTGTWTLRYTTTDFVLRCAYTSDDFLVFVASASTAVNLVRSPTGVTWTPVALLPTPSTFTNATPYGSAMVVLDGNAPVRLRQILADNSIYDLAYELPATQTFIGLGIWRGKLVTTGQGSSIVNYRIYK